jgi:hypothetical protein
MIFLSFRADKPECGGHGRHFGVMDPAPSAAEPTETNPFESEVKDSAALRAANIFSGMACGLSVTAVYINSTV